MAKSAGILKKLKKVGNLLGKGASWINNNIVKPMKPLINQGISFAAGAAGVPMLAPAINSAIDAGSNWLDNKYGTQSNEKYKNIARYGADLLMDSQRLPSDDLNYDYDEPGEYAPPPKKNYKNPFGKRIN